MELAGPGEAQMKRFDVYLIRLEPTEGSEIAKARPGAIISPDSMNRALRTVVVAPLTSTSKRWPSRVACRFRGVDGQIALDQLRAVDKSRLMHRLGKLEAATASAVSATLVEMFTEEGE